MTLNCFERALALADDDNMADVWYNIAQLAVGIGDLGLAYQAFKICVSLDSNQPEAFNNLGVCKASCFVVFPMLDLGTRAPERQY
jgi:tetratricopeptide repeat protein 8